MIISDTRLIFPPIYPRYTEVIRPCEMSRRIIWKLPDDFMPARLVNKCDTLLIDKSDLIWIHLIQDIFRDNLDLPCRLGGAISDTFRMDVDGPRINLDTIAVSFGFAFGVFWTCSVLCGPALFLVNLDPPQANQDLEVIYSSKHKSEYPLGPV